MKKRLIKNKPSRDNNENTEEREKRLAMWAGISFFMCLIAVLWVFNIRNSFSSNESSASFKEEFNEISKEFNGALEDMKIKMEELSEVVLESDEKPTSSLEKDFNDIKFVDEKNIASLKNKLEIDSNDKSEELE